MTENEADQIAARDWKDLPLEVRRTMVQEAQDRMAWQRVRRKVYARSTLAGGTIAGLIAFRDDVASLLSFLARALGADK